MRKTDIIVIGAGIAGASAAAVLAKDASVAVVEAETQPGYHSTGRSAAMYITNYGPADIRRLTVASGGFFRDPPDGFTQTDLIHKRGVLVFAPPGEEPRLDRSLAQASGAVRRLTAAEASELVPILRPDRVTAANYEPDAQDIDVAALHQGFLKQARRRGATIHLNTRVLRADQVALNGGGGMVDGSGPIRKAGAGWTVDTPDGPISAPVVVNAAGAWADEVARAFGVPMIGFVPKRRTAIIIDGPAGHESAGWPMINDVRDSWYARPEAGGKLLLSPVDATPSAPCDAAPEELDIATAIDRIQTDMDIAVRRVEHSWAGLRTFSPDGSLVIGYDPDVEGFFWLAGQGGYGIQTAPAAGELAAALIAHRSLPTSLQMAGFEPSWVAPSRFR